MSFGFPSNPDHLVFFCLTSSCFIQWGAATSLTEGDTTVWAFRPQCSFLEVPAAVLPMALQNFSRQFPKETSSFLVTSYWRALNAASHKLSALFSPFSMLGTYTKFPCCLSVLCSLLGPSSELLVCCYYTAGVSASQVVSEWAIKHS